MSDAPARFIEPSERDTISKLFWFATILRAASLMPPNEDEYWERPWKWTPEYQSWVAHGQPDPPSVTYNVQGWENFIASMEDA
jgi:hypothetical protein